MNITDAVALWQRACVLIQGQVSEKDFEVWIQDLVPTTIENGTFLLEAPFGLWRDRVKQSFLSVIEQAVSAVAKQNISVQVAAGAYGGMSSVHQKTKSSTVGLPIFRKSLVARLPKTFEGYLVGDSNRLACLVARQVAEGETLASGNPLFLHGELGLGKTHLLLAIGHHFHSRGRRVAYCQGEDLIRETMGYERSSSVSAFYNRIQIADALLLDDVQFLVGKSRIQHEFYRVLSLVYDISKPVVVTCDRSLDDLENFDDSLRRYFARGLSIEVNQLDRELRLRVLKAKLAESGIKISDNVVERLSIQLQGSVREIQGLVTRLAIANDHVVVNDEVAETIMTPYVRRRGPIDLNTIIDTVAYINGLSREELLSRDRSRRVAWPRHVAAYMCRRLTPASLPEIGDALGGRNHTSILRAVRGVTERALWEEAFALRLQQIEKVLGGVPKKSICPTE